METCILQTRHLYTSVRISFSRTQADRSSVSVILWLRREGVVGVGCEGVGGTY